MSKRIFHSLFFANLSSAGTMHKNFTSLLFLVGLLCSQVLVGQNAYFDIRNEQVIGSDYHFDVYMRADIGSTFLARGMVYILFDTTTFGNNLVLDNKVTYTHTNILVDSITIAPGFKIPKYETINIQDNGNRVVLTFVAPYHQITPPPANTLYSYWFTSVPDTFTPLYHFAFEIKRGGNPANLALDLGLMFSPVQQFFFNENAISSDNTTWTNPYGTGVLPAELAQFTGRQSGDEAVQLNWTTSREANNDYFLLEKRQGIEGEFQVIAKIEGAGDSQEDISYQHLDEGNMAEVNYYRLRQVNFNGDIALSDVVEVQFSPSSESDLLLYPNPAKNFVYLKSSGDIVAYELMSITGQVLSYSSSIDKSGQEQAIDLSNFSKGTYLIRTYHENGSSQIKHFIKY